MNRAWIGGLVLGALAVALASFLFLPKEPLGHFENGSDSAIGAQRAADETNMSPAEPVERPPVASESRTASATKSEEGRLRTFKRT